MQFLCACIRKSLLIIASVIPVNKMERKIFFRVSAAGVSWRIFFREFPPQMFHDVFSSGSFRRRCFMAYFLQGVSAADVLWHIFFREFPPQMFYGIFSSALRAKHIQKILP